MSESMVQLTFALPAFEDPMSAALSHSMEFETLSLHANSQHQIALQCVLPEAAHEGDIISLSATLPNARAAQYYTEKKLNQFDLEQGRVTLRLNQIAHSRGFVMQMILHGKHGTLKNSLQFDMHINQFGSGYTIPVTSITPPKPHRVRQYLASMGTALISLF
ncbi:MAG TPA: hypothetical protein DIT74_05520 [Pseudoalteromonas sp.]|jgi:hypothetical protein|nr:hypothetical protein [Pseudoalteromonas sp.]|tara:strand:- start:662 stop:1147 length:486 start_codon:yes stop_codon:yes gene_type:complete